MRVAAVVVTYNRKDELVKNIKAILSQSLVVDKYYIIDNHGNDCTKDLLYAEGLLENPIIEYIYLSENIGGAGGFYTGLKKAIDDGYDYVCLMDDDGRPADHEMMKNLVLAAIHVHANKQEILLNSLVCGADNYTLSFGLNGGIKTRDTAFSKAENGLILGTINPFNGTLISRELVDRIGFPNKDFFIKGDEQDYYMRAKQAEAYIATVCSSNYYHPILVREKGEILGKVIESSTEAPWKEYYRARNFTYMFVRDRRHSKLIKQIVRQIIWALKYNPERWKAVKMIIRGWLDGLRGKLGPSVKP